MFDGIANPFRAARYHSLIVEEATLPPELLVTARTADGLQPVFALIATSLTSSLLDYLAQGGRKTDTWYAQHALVEVDYEHERSAFININTHDDLSAAALRLQAE